MQSPVCAEGDGAAGHLVNLHSLDAACFYPLRSASQKAACRKKKGGGTHKEAGTHTVQEAFGQRVELRLPHRAAVQGAAQGGRRTEEGGGRKEGPDERGTTGLCRRKSDGAGRGAKGLKLKQGKKGERKQVGGGGGCKSTKSNGTQAESDGQKGDEE